MCTLGRVLCDQTPLFDLLCRILLASNRVTSKRGLPLFKRRATESRAPECTVSMVCESGARATRFEGAQNGAKHRF